MGFGIIARRDVAHILCKNISETPENLQEQSLNKKDQEKNKDLVVENYSNDAKNLANFNLCQTILAGVIVFILMNIFKANLADIYTQSN